jgi:hypothetical protein
MLLRCEYIDVAAAQVRVLCDALITLSFVAKDPLPRAALFWDYYTIEAFETASAMGELERGRAKPEHLAAMEIWLAERRAEYERLRPRYTYVARKGRDKGKTRPFKNWCNFPVRDQAKECGADLERLYRLVYKQMSSYIHCTAFSLRRQAAYSGKHYDVGVVHCDIAMLVRTTGLVWIEIAKFLSDKLGWNLMGQAAGFAEASERLDEQHFGRQQRT